MITGFISAAIALFFYWLMWLLWCMIMPKLLPTDTDQMFVTPKFWQFAIVAILVSFMFKNKN